MAIFEHPPWISTCMQIYVGESKFFISHSVWFLQRIALKCLNRFLASARSYNSVILSTVFSFSSRNTKGSNCCSSRIKRNHLVTTCIKKGKDYIWISGGALVYETWLSTILPPPTRGERQRPPPPPPHTREEKDSGTEEINEN